MKSFGMTAPGRAVPADQGFKGGDAIFREVTGQLTVQLEFAVLHGQGRSASSTRRVRRFSSMPAWKNTNVPRSSCRWVYLPASRYIVQKQPSQKNPSAMMMFRRMIFYI
jgi:hypothetical protein